MTDSEYVKHLNSALEKLLKSSGLPPAPSLTTTPPTARAAVLKDLETKLHEIRRTAEAAFDAMLTQENNLKATIDAIEDLAIWLEGQRDALD